MSTFSKGQFNIWDGILTNADVTMCSYLGKGAANPEEVEKAMGILTTCLDYYESLLSKQDFLTGHVSHHVL